MLKPVKPRKPKEPKEPLPPSKHDVDILTIESHDHDFDLGNLREYIDNSQYSWHSMFDVEIDRGYDHDLTVRCAFTSSRPNPNYDVQLEQYRKSREKYAVELETYQQKTLRYEAKLFQYGKDSVEYEKFLARVQKHKRLQEYNRLKEEFGE